MRYTFFLILTISLLTGVHGFAQVTRTKSFNKPNQVFEKKWRTKVPQCVSMPGESPAASKGEPLLINGIMFYPGGYCSAIDMASGKVLSFGNPVAMKRIRAALHGDSLLIFPSDKTFAIVNFNTGDFEYLEKRDGSPAALNTPVLVKENLVVFAIDRYTLACLDIKARKVLWRFQSKVEVSEQYVSFRENFVVSDNESIYWLDKMTGKTVSRISSGGRFYSNLLVEGNSLVVQFRNKGIANIDLSSRKIKWWYNSSHANVFLKILSDSKTITFFLDGLTALKFATGDVVWKNAEVRGGTLTNWLASTGEFLIFYTHTEDDAFPGIYRAGSGAEAFTSWTEWQEGFNRNYPVYFGDCFLFSQKDSVLYGYDYEFIGDDKVYYAYAYSLNSK